MSIGIPQMVAWHHGDFTKMELVYLTEEGGVVTGKTSPVLAAAASDYPTRSSLTPGGLKPPINRNFVLKISRKQTMKQTFNVFPGSFMG